MISGKKLLDADGRPLRQGSRVVATPDGWETPVRGKVKELYPSEGAVLVEFDENLEGWEEARTSPDLWRRVS